MTTETLHEIVNLALQPHHVKQIMFWAFCIYVLIIAFKLQNKEDGN